MTLQKKLVQEYEWEAISKEEVKIYKQRIHEMKNELWKTEGGYKTRLLFLIRKFMTIGTVHVSEFLLERQCKLSA